MITTINFDTKDFQIIEAGKKGVRVYLFIFIMLLTPLSFLLGLIGLARGGFGYWPMTTAFLLFFFLMIIYLFIKESIQYKKDLRDKLKYSGTITVVKKSQKMSACAIYTDSEELNKIDVLLFDVFDQIEVGDDLYIEAAKFSKYIFKLERGIIPLIEGY